MSPAVPQDKQAAVPLRVVALPVRWAELRAAARPVAARLARWAVVPRPAAARQAVPQARWVVLRAEPRVAAGPLARWVAAPKAEPLRERWVARPELAGAKREPRVIWAAHKARAALLAAWPVVAPRQVPVAKVAHKAVAIRKAALQAAL